MTFISAYLEHTKEYESPGSFWKWSSYAAISAVLRDNCYRRQGDTVLFPSTYILLLGGSGSRKNWPVSLCEDLVVNVGNTKVISGRSSIQAILDELSQTETDSKTGKMVKGGSAIFFAPELAGGLVADPQALSILTDIYDSKKSFTSRLRTSPKFKIERLVFNALMASNEALVRDLYTQQAKEGGLLARTFLIVPNEFRPPNSLMKFSDKTKSVEDLINRLRKIGELRGEFIFNEDAIIEYDSWYNPFRYEQKTRQDKTGVINRIHTGILKLAMILAANELTLQVKKEHISEAILECIKLLPNYNMFAMTGGKGTIEQAGAVVLQALLNARNHTMTQADLLIGNWSTFDIELLDKVTVTFEIAGLTKRVTEGTVTTYTLTPKGLEILLGKGGEAREPGKVKEIR